MIFTYLLKSGCQWRVLPGEFPEWRSVHSYFAKLSEPDRDGGSVLEWALKNQVGATRTRQRRSAMTSFLILDTQSVKSTDIALDGTGARHRSCSGDDTPPAASQCCKVGFVGRVFGRVTAVHFPGAFAGDDRPAIPADAGTNKRISSRTRACTLPW